LTILVISVIAALTLEFNRSMRTEVDTAAALQKGIKARCIARSAFDYALAVLVRDSRENAWDTLKDPWADPEGLSAASAPMFESGRFEVAIEDLSGKIPINELVDPEGNYRSACKTVLKNLLISEAVGLESEAAENLLDAIKDWIDADDEITRFGAESAFYETLPDPYRCKNAPLSALEELLLVRGVSKALFYGTNENAGISDYLTVQGDKININTADRTVLGSLSEQLEPQMLDDMLAYREEEQNELENPDWYHGVPGMAHVQLAPEMITTASTCFRIHAKGILEDFRAGIHGDVKRTAGDLKVIRWRID